MKNKYRIIALAASMIFTSCTNVDKNIEFLNSKDFMLITFCKEYDELKKINHYYTYNSESEFSSQKFNNAYRCVAINGEDVDVSFLTTSLFNNIADVTSKYGSLLVLTGFDDYSFLDDSLFESPGKLGVKNNEYYMYCSKGEGRGYNLTEITAMDGNSTMKFDSFIINEVYRKIYEFEKNQ